MQAGRGSNLDSSQAGVHPSHKLYRLDTGNFSLALINQNLTEDFNSRIFRPMDRRGKLTGKLRRCRSRNHHLRGQVDTKETCQSNLSHKTYKRTWYFDLTYRLEALSTVGSTRCQVNACASAASRECAVAGRCIARSTMSETGA